MRGEAVDIFEDLQQKLITAQLKSEAKLKPAELQDQYGCSANTVREALLRLSTVGLVTFRNQRGFRVASISTERRKDVARFRIMLEQEGAVLSMRFGGVAWESRVSAAHHKLKHIETQLEREGPIETLMALWSSAEVEFHETLISACDSELMRTTYANVYVQFRQQFVGLEPNFTPKYFAEIIGEHQAILDAALSRDADACRVAIEAHLVRYLHDGRAQAKSLQPAGMSSSR